MRNPVLSQTSVRILEGSVAETVSRLSADIRFQLIYCDPPFYSGKTQSSDFATYEDRWPSLNAYLTEMETSMRTMASVVSDSGFFVIHCDWHASHYLKIMGDRIFGYENFRNEIVWHYKGRRQPAILRLNSKHDVLLVWAKSLASRMNALAEPVDRDDYVKMKRQPVNLDEDGREWIWGHMGRGRSKAYRIYIDEVVARGKPLDDVWDIPIINLNARERVGYPTQKPLALLERVVTLLSHPNDWVGDFMAGSGTLGVAAAHLGRQVILADRSPEAVAIMRERMQTIQVELVFDGHSTDMAQPESLTGDLES